MSTKRRSDPTEAMNGATAALERAGVHYEKKTAFHLKVNAFNFWPATGTITHDDELKKRDENGLPTFIRLLRDAGLAKALYVHAVDDPADFIKKTKPNDPGFETY